MSGFSSFDFRSMTEQLTDSQFIERLNLLKVSINSAAYDLTECVRNEVLLKDRVLRETFFNIIDLKLEDHFLAKCNNISIYNNDINESNSNIRLPRRYSSIYIEFDKPILYPMGIFFDPIRLMKDDIEFREIHKTQIVRCYENLESYFNILIEMHEFYASTLEILTSLRTKNRITKEFPEIIPFFPKSNSDPKPEVDLTKIKNIRSQLTGNK